MSKEKTKKELEYRLFERFALQKQWPCSPALVKHGGKGEPDWTYSGLSEIIAFEITTVIEPELARDRAAPSGKVVWLESNVEAVIRNKLNKKYVSNYPIELVLCHSDAMAPDDSAVPQLQAEVNAAITVPFRKIWYSGEHGPYLIYPHAVQTSF